MGQQPPPSCPYTLTGKRPGIERERKGAGMLRWGKWGTIVWCSRAEAGGGGASTTAEDANHRLHRRHSKWEIRREKVEEEAPGGEKLEALFHIYRVKKSRGLLNPILLVHLLQKAVKC